MKKYYLLIILIFSISNNIAAAKPNPSKESKDCNSIYYKKSYNLFKSKVVRKFLRRVSEDVVSGQSITKSSIDNLIIAIEAEVAKNLKKRPFLKYLVPFLAIYDFIIKKLKRFLVLEEIVELMASKNSTLHKIINHPILGTLIQYTIFQDFSAAPIITGFSIKKVYDSYERNLFKPYLLLTSSNEYPESSSEVIDNFVVDVQLKTKKIVSTKEVISSLKILNKSRIFCSRLELIKKEFKANKELNNSANLSHSTYIPDEVLINRNFIIKNSLKPLKRSFGNNINLTTKELQQKRLTKYLFIHSYSEIVKDVSHYIDNIKQNTTLTLPSGIRYNFKTNNRVKVLNIAN